MSSSLEIFPNHLFKDLHKKWRQQLENKYVELKNSKHSFYLSIYRYINTCPEKYYNREIFDKYYSFLSEEYKNNSQEFTNLLNQKYDSINRAFVSLNEINRLNWHDKIDTSNDYQFIQFCDYTLNPVYLKLTESIYFPFIYLLAYVLRKKREKNIDGLDVYNCVEELNQFGDKSFCREYDNIIRNGIAHGGITYLHKQIRYQDKKGNIKTISNSEIVQLVDNIIDSCNAFALASKIFYIVNLDKNIRIPQQYLIEELSSETESTWWKINGSVYSETMYGQSQLIIYIQVNTRDFPKVQYFSYMTAVLCEQLSPGYQRYFLSFLSTIALPGWAVFDGVKLETVRKSDPQDVKSYADVLVDNQLVFIPKFKIPRLFGRVDSFIQSFRVTVPPAIDDLKKQLGQIEFIVRDVTIHRNGWRLVLNGSVVIRESEVNWRKVARKIIRKSLKISRKKEKNILLKILPLGFARLSIFNCDYRVRILRNYGLGQDLICTIQFQKIKRMKVPDIMGSKIEKIGSYRFAWNRAWLDL